MERKTVETDRLYIDIVSPGMSTRGDLKKYILDNMMGLVYLPTQVVDGFPPQQVPKMPEKEAHIRKAPNNIAEVAAFLTGYAGSFVREKLSEPRGRDPKGTCGEIRSRREVS